MNYEITDLASPTALQRFGAPFRSEHGEVAPQDSEFPLLRYIFVNHVRNFPFLDQAKEKEFWQDRLQVFLEIFANKHISSSEDRLEETKRRKLALKAKKLVELMMVSGIPTASGYEERINFSEMEIVDRAADDSGLVANIPEGNSINNWDVNVAGVKTISIKRTVRYHQHAQFILRVRKGGSSDIYIGRRYGEFQRLHKRLRNELPGKVLPPLPRKNRTGVTSALGGGGSDSDSASSVSTRVRNSEEHSRLSVKGAVARTKRSSSISSSNSRRSGTFTPAESGADNRPITLFREEQRVSLRAFLRTILQNEQIANSKAISDFLSGEPLVLNQEERRDIQWRREMDEKRIKEQKEFYEIAQQRARELDVYMEKFRRDVIEHNGLTKLFAEIREKDKLDDLSLEYKKFAEWARIEVAAVIYHLFLAEDNSPELFAQFKRIHSMLPYTALKQIVRFTNPAFVMNGVLDLFLAQPFGARSAAQRILGFAIGDGIKTYQKAVDSLANSIEHPVLCEKLRNFCYADEDVKNRIRSEAVAEDKDLLIAIMQSPIIEPQLSEQELGGVFETYLAWNNAVESEDSSDNDDARTFADLKQLLKMYTRQRDKEMMLNVIEERVTLQLFRDLFNIFYQPLVRVYKSANVYNSVTDFAAFADDTIKVVEQCQIQDVSADPNKTVQSFIDLCARHEHNLYNFIHEVHLHDNGLFDKLMGWIEDILEFLRKGPQSGFKLDMNALFQGAVSSKQVDKEKAIEEINSLIAWQAERKRWHNRKTRQKMAAEGDNTEQLPGSATFKPADFGLAQDDLDDLNEDDYDDEDEDDEQDEMDPIEAERRRRNAKQGLRRTAGEPVKPLVEELPKLQSSFVSMLRMVLAD